VFFADLPRHSRTTAAYPARRAFAGAHPGAARVLVVEDDPLTQDVLVGILAEAGFAVETVATGAQALARAAAQAFDAVTLDLVLPDMGGLDVLRGLRTSGANPSAAVIVVSVTADRRAVGGFRVHDVLPKPVDQATLLASLHRAGVAPPQRGAAVLVVDDDAGSRRLMEALVEQLGYGAFGAADGATGLSLAASERPVAVVLDLLMPEMDGFAFLDRFRKLPEHRRTPVVVWTAKDLTSAESARLRASVQGIVSKASAGRSALLEEIRAFLPTAPADEPARG
jgi:CheY-like chemotaxis protein